MGTRNILAITTTVQCVADVVQHAVTRIKAELLPKYPNVDDVVSLGHTYGCGVAIDAPDAMVPIRTVRNIALNPNFGGEVMMVSLGCEKLQPERLMPPGTIPIAAAAVVDDVADIGDVALDQNGDVVVLQDESHVGFQSMITSIMILLNCALGLVHPPIGSVQFIGCAIGNVSIGETTKVAWPYYLAIFSAINIVTYVPWFSTWLPSIINGHPVF